MIESSGTENHPILKYTGNKSDFVEGTLFEISAEELIQADNYEVDDYKRAELIFESKQTGFAYVKNESIEVIKLRRN